MDGHLGSAGRSAEIAFDPSRKGLTGIAVKGFLLSLVTFGIYRFWYMTELRRFFWSRTLVDGSPGEYTGTGKEIFLGFLVALAILVPIYLGIFAVSLLFSALAGVASLLGFVVLFGLGQFAIYRGRRYRAARTLWRGIRLGQDGSGLAYAAMALGWWILTLLTLGLAFPFMRAGLERYRIRHTLIGRGRMESSARGTMVLGHWLLLYGVGLLPPLAMLAALFAANHYALPRDLMVTQPGKAGNLMLNPAYRGLLVGQIAIALPFVSGLAIAAALLLFPYYRARETRAFMNAARLDEVRLISTLRARAFYWPYLVYVGALLAFAIALGLAGVLIAVLGYTAGLGTQTTGAMRVAAVVGVLAAYLGGAMLFAVLYVRVVQTRLWAAVADSARISDAQALAAIVASGRGPGSGLNEGLADALDVGGALQIGF